MNEIILGRPLDKLIRRRGQIVMTLHHLAAEQKQVEQNTDWLDQAAYESRVNLLDGLSDCCVAEIGQVDKAIERIENHRYGFCIACHQAIEEARLETGPAAEFCSVWEELRAGCAASELTRCTPEVTTALRIIGRRFVSAGASQRTSDPSYKSHEPLV
jgi:RNA polymerase-binding transcription factor DksA